MAGQRRPGSWGLGTDPPIDDGTMPRAATPPPGPVGFDYGYGTQTGSSNVFTWLSGGASAGVDVLSQAVANLESSDSWITLQPLVVSLVGPQTFGLGVVYGMGENIVGGVLGLAQLAKTFLLADQVSTCGEA